ncbi:LCP family protein [Phycicoccus sp. BSK3Z-2]|uniref:LCP family protein n=1 Tax=Phycicoccus avicenniae TaxID=2828860 RepID=A0A941D823_9MICO|nr:LCP family protein [Phycicoccus avicenniae]MBR7743485.1 LCP family protein [Phycicoccus avicenniae]
MSDDHARPIPRRPAASDDDVEVVDTRRRRAAGRKDSRASAAPPPPPPPSSGRRSTPPPPPPPGGTRYDELGRPVRSSPPPPGGGRGGRGGRRRRRVGPVRWVLLLLLAWVAFVLVTPVHAWTTVVRADTAPAGERPADGDGHTYLLVGSDSREGLTDEERSELGTGSAEGRRTDTIILVHVPSGAGKAVLLSVPRDSYLPIPGNGSNKVNAAFAIGGPQLLVQTLEQSTGLRIDGYAEIGFGGFARVVDSLGGVEICVETPIDDDKAHITLDAGCQTLDGRTSLGYVRARYSDPRGDIGRAERQRQFLGAVMSQAARPSTVLPPWRWWGFTHAGASSVVVGEDTGLVDSARLLQALRGVSGGDTLSLVVPIADANATTAAGSSVIWDEEQARSLFTMLRDGTPVDAPPPGTTQDDATG